MKTSYAADLRRFSERMLKAGTTAGRKAGDVAHEAIREWAEIWHRVLGENGHSASTESKSSKDQIAARAYEIWTSKGCPKGTSEEDWAQAERQLSSK